MVSKLELSLYSNVKLGGGCLVLGSFKIRGVGGQLSKLHQRYPEGVKGLVCMSGGNYGKAMAYLAQKESLPATVVMDDTAPASRETIIKVTSHRSFILHDYCTCNWPFF